MSQNHEDIFRPVAGLFYRAVDPRYLQTSLAGSRNAGRYSNPEQPTLYLSSSPKGVEAAMIAHTANRAKQLQIVAVSVKAQRIFDLRNEKARIQAGISLEDATAPWQDCVARGTTPPSWHVRDRLVALGAQGLIDPSRKAPGLWHLVLFNWNGHDQPTIEAIAPVNEHSDITR